MTYELSPQVVQARLGLSGDALPWLQELSALNPPSQTVWTSSSAETEALLPCLAVPANLVGDVVDAMPTPDGDPALWWISGGALASLGLVIYSPVLQSLFRFTALGIRELALCLLAAIISVLWFEAIKLLVFRRM